LDNLLKSFGHGIKGPEIGLSEIENALDSISEVV